MVAVSLRILPGAGGPTGGVDQRGRQEQHDTAAVGAGLDLHAGGTVTSEAVAPNGCAFGDGRLAGGVINLAGGVGEIHVNVVTQAKRVGV